MLINKAFCISLLCVSFEPTGYLVKLSVDPLVLLQEKPVFFIIVNLQEVFCSLDRDGIA